MHEEKDGRYIRYSVTCIGRNGERKFAMPSNQRHNFWDKYEDAERWLKACLDQPDNIERLRQIHGDQATGTFEVSAFECYSYGEAKSLNPLGEG